MLSRHLKKGALRRCSSRIKPLLSDANKLERVNFCGMDGAGEADEKWFNADKD
ncbi:unnamed protein product, partial [Aphanomyces euteiches]